jgi:hypothetical protein
MGGYPRDVRWVTAGAVNGTSYRHDAVLLVAGGPALSPFARGFDPHRLPRIQAIEAELDRWLAHFDRHPEERYVSDGDPAGITVPPGTSGRVHNRGARVVERP